MFLKSSQQPSLWAVVLPSIVLHGMFDYGLTAAATAASREQLGLTVFFTLLVVCDLLASFLFIAYMTGATCTCCCSPGFWQRSYDTSYSETSGDRYSASLL